MRAWLTFLVFVLGVGLVHLARAEDAKAVKTGGNFEVEVIKDVPYYEGKDADPERHKLDLYFPKGQKDFPVLVWAHGGGWTKGDKRSFAKQGQTFAKNGVAVVSVGYRLSPKVQHPAHAQDVAKAIAFTHQHIAHRGGSPDQIFISGHSAGGHLVALIGTDESYLKAEKLSLANIKGVIPVSGVYTIRPGRGQVFGSDEEVCRQASPLTHVSGNDPPFLILYADKDSPPMAKMADEFSQALQETKCEAACMKINDRTHGSIATNIANLDDPATQAILTFIAKHSNLKLTSKQ
jgi:acetyl esterase/lipase